MLASKVRLLAVRSFSAPVEHSGFVEEKRVMEGNRGLSLKIGSYAEKVSSAQIIPSDKVWVQLDEMGVPEREAPWNLCLVGKLEGVPNLEPWVLELRKSVDRRWIVKKKVRISVLGVSFCCFEFENEEDLTATLLRGLRKIEDKILEL